MKMDVKEATKIYGLNPETIGIRHRAWGIVQEIEDEENVAGAEIGDLVVRARDGNIPDPTAFRAPNYRGTAQNGFDGTYRYYYFSPLKEKEAGE